MDDAYTTTVGPLSSPECFPLTGQYGPNQAKLESYGIPRRLAIMLVCQQQIARTDLWVWKENKTICWRVTSGQLAGDPDALLPRNRVGWFGGAISEGNEMVMNTYWVYDIKKQAVISSPTKYRSRVMTLQRKLFVEELTRM